MIEHILLLFISLCTLTSVSVGAFATNFKNPVISIILGLKGMFVGIIVGTVWLYVTKGTEITLFSMILPIIISTVTSYLMVGRLKKSFRNEDFLIGKSVHSLVILGVFILAFIVAFTSMPLTYDTIANSQALPLSELDMEMEWSTGQKEVQSVETVTTPQQVYIESNFMGSASSVGTLAEQPYNGAYYSFNLKFQSDVPWNKPYLKIGVYKDIDGDGSVSEGDMLWSDTNYKISTDNSLWRTNCVWKDNQPMACAFSSGDTLLPIFHAEKINQVFNEQEIKFHNTPEQFISSKDMISWEFKEDCESCGGTIQLKEQPLQFAALSKGEVTSIEGTIYCPSQSVGNNLLVVQAYDAESKTLDQIYNGEDTPVKETIIPFTVTQSVEQATIMGIPHMMAVVILGILALAGIVFAKKEGYL